MAEPYHMASTSKFRKLILNLHLWVGPLLALTGPLLWWQRRQRG